MAEEESDLDAAKKGAQIKALQSPHGSHPANDLELEVRPPWRPPKKLPPMDDRVIRNPLMKSMKKDTWLRRSFSDARLDYSRKVQDLSNKDDRFAYLGVNDSFSKRPEPLAELLGPKQSFKADPKSYGEQRKDRFLELFGAEVDLNTGTFLKLHSSEAPGTKKPSVEKCKNPSSVFVRDRARQLTIGLGPPYMEHGYISPPANLTDVGGESGSAGKEFLSHSYGKLYKQLAETYYSDEKPAQKSFKRARRLLGPQTNIRVHDHLNNPVEKKLQVLFKGVTVIRPPTPPPPPPPPPPTEDEWTAAQSRGPAKWIPPYAREKGGGEPASPKYGSPKSAMKSSRKR